MRLDVNVSRYWNEIHWVMWRQKPTFNWWTVSDICVRSRVTSTNDLRLPFWWRDSIKLMSRGVVKGSYQFNNNEKLSLAVECAHYQVINTACLRSLSRKCQQKLTLFSIARMRWGDWPNKPRFSHWNFSGFCFCSRIYSYIGLLCSTAAMY